MIPLLLMGLALIILALVGDLTLRLFKMPTMLPAWQHAFVVFWIGQALGTWLLWLIGIIGLPMWSVGALCFSLYLLCGYGFLWKKGALQFAKNKKDDFSDNLENVFRKRLYLGFWWLLLGAVCCFVIGIFIMAGMSYPVQGATGLGNWLFKAKWFLLSESWPSDYFTHGGHNRHLAYPPGFPLLTGWCAWVMGGLDVYWIRALPVFLLSAAFCLAAACLERSIRGLSALIGLVILFSHCHDDGQHPRRLCLAS